MDRQEHTSQDNLLDTLATIMTKSSSWHEFCDYMLEELQALACCFVFFSESQQAPVLQPCQHWPTLAEWQHVDYSALQQQGAFYEVRANKVGAYFTVPIKRGPLSGLLVIQYHHIPVARRSWRTLVDMFAHYGALLWQEQSGCINANIFKPDADGVMITDAEHCITHVNTTFTKITGYAAAQVLGEYPYLLPNPIADGAFYQELSEYLQAKNHWQGEILSARCNGQRYTLLLEVSAAKDKRGQILTHTAVLSDMSYAR